MLAPAPLRPVDAVREYYERNTWLFLAVGVERHTYTMHRPIWADGVANMPEAVRYIMA